MIVHNYVLEKNKVYKFWKMALMTEGSNDKKKIYWFYKNPNIGYQNQALYFLKITEALCPPKPNVLLRAAFTVRF